MTNLLSLDLNLLKILDALLSEGSTVRAGQKIGLSQPAVSAALARLRHAFGDELFLRQGQGLVPTDYAMSLAIPLREAMSQLETALNGPGTFDPVRSTNVFQLTGSDFFTDLLMPVVAARLTDRAPLVRVRFKGLIPDEQLDLVEQREVDLALIPRIDVPGWADQRPAATSTFRVVARSGHPRIAKAGLKSGDVIPLDLYCDLGHVMYSTKGSFSGLADEALERLGRRRRVAITMPVFSATYHTVAGSDLVALLPHQLAYRACEMLDLDVFMPPMPVGPVHLSMIWHRRTSANPAQMWFRDFVLDCCETLG